MTTPNPTPPLRELTDERIIIDGKEIDLSASTRDDLIHFLRLHAGASGKRKQDYISASRIIGILIGKLGGKATITRQEMMTIDGTEIERWDDHEGLHLSLLKR